MQAATQAACTAASNLNTPTPLRTGYVLHEGHDLDQPVVQELALSDLRVWVVGQGPGPFSRWLQGVIALSRAARRPRPM